MTIHPTDPDNLPPISASLDPTGLAREHRDRYTGEGYANHCGSWWHGAVPYAFQWSEYGEYGPSLLFPLPPATIAQEPPDA